jgi:hypothetical protein
MLVCLVGCGGRFIMNFIEKPFSPDAFVRKVREVLDKVE